MAKITTPPEVPARAPSPQPPRWPIVVAGVIGVLVLVVLTIGAARLIGGGGAPAVEAGIPVEVTIESGMSAATIYRLLEDEGVAPVEDLRDAARALAVEDRLRAGTYRLTTGMDAEAAIESLARGTNATDAGTVTIVEGWTVETILEALAAATGRPVDDFTTVLSEGAVTSSYLPPRAASTAAGPTELERWEGLLYPATYPIPADGDPVALLGAMADEFATRADRLDWSRLDALGVTRYDAIIVASLIEREAGTDEERATIASVIYNRLADGMRLQIDATVVYALGENPGRVLAEHLEVDSPYNTYRVDGLPPTPIGAPSLASLEAALRPAQTPFRFYVLGSTDGSHLFAETYEEHQENIRIAEERGVRE